MKKMLMTIPVILLALCLAACGGGADAAQTAAAAETTKAAETTAAEETEAEAEEEKETAADEDTDGASDTSEEAKDLLTEDGFRLFFDMLLEDFEDPDDFYVDYKGKSYKYDDLGDLYEALAKDGGKGKVSLVGEAEEELDFEMMAALLSFDGGDEWDDGEEYSFDEDGEGEATPMTPERFTQYFDMLIADNGLDADDFYLEYGGRKYWYDELDELLEAMEEAGGTIDAKIMGEEEEMLDLEIMSGYLDFMSGWDAWETGSGLGNIDQEFIDRFYGDWHGVVKFRDCTGKYKDSLGADPDWTNSIARFIIDSDGYVVPFIGIHVEDTPIMDLEATLAPEDDCMYLSGSWINVPFEEIPMTEKNGTLHCEIPIAKEAGSFTMVFNLRHLNDTGWTNEDPALPEDYIVHCQGWSFDKLAESNGYTNWDYPSYSAGEEPEYPVQIAQEEEKEDFGKTTEGADGIVSKKKLQAGYDWLMEEFWKDRDPIPYEEIRDAFGVDGTKDMPAQWTEERHVYEWQTEGEKDWVSVIFHVNPDGSETMTTINQSQDILDTYENNK